MILALLAQAAEALSCLEPRCVPLLPGGSVASNQALLVVPEPGAHCSGDEMLEGLALERDGARVRLRIQKQGDIYRAVPWEGWERGAAYRFLVVYEVEEEIGVPEEFQVPRSGVLWSQSVTATGAVDEEPPPTPQIKEVRRVVRGSLGRRGGSNLIEVDLRGRAPEDVYYEVEYSRLDGDFGSEVLIFPDTRPIVIGDQTCRTNARLTSSGEYRVRVRAIDTAGNASPWADTHPPALGFDWLGCAAGPGSAGAGGLLALAGLLARRRRGMTGT